MSPRLAKIKPAVDAAMQLLAPAMDTREARVMVYAICLQESALLYRRQKGNGPARGFWQFEQGTVATRGGVTGVCLHPVTASHLRRLCAARGVEFEPAAIWRAIEADDVLAAGLARLMLLTDARRLPGVGDVQGGWDCYARTWRPGKPHRETWDDYYAEAREAVLQGEAP